MRRVALFLLAFAGLPLASLVAQQPEKRCVILIVGKVGHNGLQDTPFGGNLQYDAGGGVNLNCRGQKTYFGGDSLHSINAVALFFYTKAYYRDLDYSITADTLSYAKQTEIFKAVGHVVLTDLRDGSTLVGPYLEYKRPVQGVRDSADVLAIGRPTVRYFTARTADDNKRVTPYVVVANAIFGFGKSHLRAIGDALVDRDSLHASGDSISFLRGKNAVARIWGVPGLIRRASKDSFFVLGRQVIIGLADDKIRDVRALGLAHVTNAGSQVVADTILMTFTNEKLGLTLAWDHASSATVHNAGYFVRGDSVAIETPNELLRELRVFGRAMVQNPTDSLRPLLVPKRTLEDTVESVLPDKDTMTGFRIIAKFIQVDSAGTKQTRLDDVESIGGKGQRATSFTARTVTKGSTTSPSVTYIRADTIRVEMKHGDSTGVALVNPHGNVDGVQLETASAAKTKADSLKAALPVKRP